MNKRVGRSQFCQVLGIQLTSLSNKASYIALRLGRSRLDNSRLGFEESS